MRTKRKRTHGTAKQLQKKAVRMGAVAACFVVVAGCQPEAAGGPMATAQPAQGGSQQQQAKTVNVSKVQKQLMGDIPKASADLTSALQSDVTVKSGGTVEKLLKKRGDRVAKGEVILTLSSPELHMHKERAALAVTSAVQAIEKAKRDAVNGRKELANSILKTETELAAGTKQYNKLRNDYDVGLADKAQVEQAELKLKTLRMDLELLRMRQSAAEAEPSLASLELQLKNAQLTLQQMEQALESLQVKAAMDGVLAELAVEEGMELASGAVIGHTVNLDRLTAKVTLNEEAAKLVKAKRELTLEVPGSTVTVKAGIRYLSALMNPQTKGYELNLELDNTAMGLMPGTKVLVRLAEAEEQMAVAVPSFSIIREAEAAYIFVVSGETAEKRKVELGRLQEPLQEIVSGVQAGELIVTSGQTLLKDRDSVKVASTDGRK